MKKLLTAALLAAALMTAGGLTHADAAALDARHAFMVTISALAAQGDIPRLETALADGLDAGLTVNEEKEILIQLYAYAGFPRSLNALNALIRVTDARQAAGIEDVVGPEAAPLDPSRDRLAEGTAAQTRLIGRPASGRLYDEFAPVINTFLREHLFSDIFSRDVLTPRDRELATVSFLAGIGNVNAQLTGHIRGSMNMGVTEAELREAVEVLTETVGEETGANAKNVLESFWAK